MVLSPRELDQKATQLRRGRGGWMYWAKVLWVSCSSRRAHGAARGSIRGVGHGAGALRRERGDRFGDEVWRRMLVTEY